MKKKFREDKMAKKIENKESCETCEHKQDSGQEYCIKHTQEEVKVMASMVKIPHFYIKETKKGKCIREM